MALYTAIWKKYVKTRTHRSTAFLILSFITFLLPPAAYAQAITGYDLVNAVNALRASEGLAAYNVDPGLMAYAQEHSNYMAITHTSTHIHQDGNVSQTIGLQENVAGGDVKILTVAIVVNEIWVDWGHRHILTGYLYGDIGAGWALGDDGLIYCSVNVRPRKDNPTYAPPVGTAAPFTPYGKSTPDESGSIIHVVNIGQTLWGIAVSYGTTMDEIRRLNALASDWTMVFPGQKLRIPKVDITAPPQTATTQALSSPMAAPTDTPAVLSTPSQTEGTVPRTSIMTPAPAPSGDAPNLLILGLVCLLGLVMMGAFVAGLLDLSKRDRR